VRRANVSFRQTLTRVRPLSGFVLFRASKHRPLPLPRARPPPPWRPIRRSQTPSGSIRPAVRTNQFPLT
jgi:hypothetical protein